MIDVRTTMRMRAFAAVVLAAWSLLWDAPAFAEQTLRLSTRLSDSTADLPVARSELAPASTTAAVAKTTAEESRGGVAQDAAEVGREAQAAGVSPAAKRVRIPEYRIGTEDLIEVEVFGVDQLKRTVRVDSRGVVSLPLIGLVELAGLTVQEAQALITAKLAESYLQNPQVSIFIKEFTTQRVTVEGAVNRPGIYPLKGPTTLLTAIALAGGQARFSEMNEVVLFRTDSTGKRVVAKFDVEKIRRGEAADPVVINEDLIVVNRSPGRVALRDSILGDLLDVLNPFRYIPAP